MGNFGSRWEIWALLKKNDKQRADHFNFLVHKTTQSKSKPMLSSEWHFKSILVNAHVVELK